MNGRTRVLLIAAVLPTVAAVMISSQGAGAKKVAFSDGMAWDSGRIYRPSPSGPGKWHPIDQLTKLP